MRPGLLARNVPVGTRRHRPILLHWNPEEPGVPRSSHRRLLLLLAGALTAVSVLLGACDNDDPTTPLPPDPDLGCATVAWDSLLAVDATYLSTYRLFTVPTDATFGAADRGTPYGLNTALFTDYASKYRFVFIPCDSAAAYDENEAFAFPVGTVITKTFALPADTGVRGAGHETIIETRLLIRRPDGWVALPYVWLPDGSDAVLDLDGATQAASLVHRGTTRNFTYRVPSQAQCAACHTRAGELAPIGPKSANLNGEFVYPDGTRNQLAHWRDAGLLTGLPGEPATLQAMPVFDDDTDLATLTDPVLRERTAKAYLDVNCAHCHRPDGSWANRTPYYQYWRPVDPTVADNDHGICRTIRPGNALGSGVRTMMNIGLMPREGSALVHREGLALVEAWINGLTHTCP